MSQLQSDPHHSLHYTDHPLPSTERTAGRDDPKFAAVPRRDDPKFPFVDLEESHPKYYQNPNTYIQHEHDALEVGEPRGSGSKSERTVGGIRRRVFWTIIVVASVVVVIVAVAGGIGGYFAGKAKSQSSSRNSNVTAASLSSGIAHNTASTSSPLQLTATGSASSTNAASFSRSAPSSSLTIGVYSSASTISASSPSTSTQIDASTSTTAPATSTSAPTSTAVPTSGLTALDCPNINSTTYTAPSAGSEVFQILCDVDYQTSSDLQQLPALTMDDCVDACANRNTGLGGCLGVTFNRNLTLVNSLHLPGNCFLKGDVSVAVTDTENRNVQASAKLLASG
ncbi:hypothetical protein L207DRAFT_582388 [Hyaloscypha variabilis F]|uniref:Apple domain-containing protein n=1 Tax=Hyaloscypha variabilis (strain UAMH 11265 / GT02V1 / F) TaxID=1149755 RepID=A0A2J6RNS0_HYAVF|nr:hypothetical protein L207DRAFT_582388 [Hyaloscypha variabilis F]